MGKGSVQELIDTIEGEACKSLIPNLGRNSLVVDDILWYLDGQYKSILHTIKVLNIYKFRLVEKSYSKQKARRLSEKESKQLMKALLPQQVEMQIQTMLLSGSLDKDDKPE